MCSLHLLWVLAPTVFAPYRAPQTVCKLHEALLDAEALTAKLPALRGAALCNKVVAAIPGASVAEFEASLGILEVGGLDATIIAELLRKRPTAVRRLVRSPEELTELVKGLSWLGVLDVGALLSSQPKLLDLDASRLAEAVDFLEGYVGGRERVGEFVALHPQSLLWRSANALPVAQHLRALGMSKAAVERVRAALPTLDALVSADNVAALLTYVQAELGLSVSSLGRLISRYPQLLGLSLEANVRPTLEYLASLGVSPARAFTRHPQLFGLSIDANLRPTVDYLRELGVDVARAVSAQPAVLSLSLEANVVPTVAYLRSIGMRELGRSLTAQPSILELSVSANLEPKLAFLRSLGMDRLPGGLGGQLDAYPTLLTLSVEGNLRPTAEALRRAGLFDAIDDAEGDEGVSCDDGAGADGGGVAGGGAGGAGGAANAPPGSPPTLLRPRHLAASLEGRVLPRLAFCSARQAALETGTLKEEEHAREEAEEEEGVVAAEAMPDVMASGGRRRRRRRGRRGFRERITLGAVTTMPDAAFAQHMGASADEYAQFKAAWIAASAPKKPAVSIPWLPEGFDLDIAWLPDGFDLAGRILDDELEQQG
jgi:hypothetical protein